MSHRCFKDRLYEQFARVGSALASEKRLELVDLLAQAPRHVEALAAETEMSIANVSQHLQVLRQAGLADSERQGAKVYYRLASGEVVQLWLSLRSVARAQLADVNRVVRDFAILEGELLLSRSELERRVAAGDVILIDVRPCLEYEYGHIAGAISLPVEELPVRLAELPPDRPIVAYCRGTYCLFADEAVALLKEHGFDAIRLDGGWPEWWAEGRAVAVGSGD